MGDGATKRGPEHSFAVVNAVGRGGTAEGARAVRMCKGTNVPQNLWVKRLRADRRDPQYVAAFQREALLAAEMQHSNIPQLLEAGPDYLMFALVPGVDLRQLLLAEQRLSVEITTLIVVEVAKALQYAHTRVRGAKPAGVVHCDVSPANILISVAGEVKLTDFAVAQPLGTAAKPSGKVPYMAPEQWFSDELIDGRADIFALGVCMYELLSGTRPAVGSDDEIFAALSAGQHTPLRELAPEVAPAYVQIVERCLAPRPADRYGSAAQLLQAFDKLPPLPTATLKLGSLALKHREYETLDYEAVGEQLKLHLVAGAAPNVAAPQASAATATAPPRPTAAVSPVRQTQLPEPAATEDLTEVLPPRARTRLRLPKALAYSAAAGIAALIAVLGLSPFSSHPPSATAPPPSTPRQQTSESSTNAATIAAAAPSPATVPNEPVTRPSPQQALSATAPVTDIPSPTPLPAATSTTAPNTPPKRAPTGFLHVGSVPPERVWIDGVARGWTDLTNRLSVGPHVVVVGKDASDPRAKTVTIEAKKTSYVACIPSSCDVSLPISK
ncbi:MAG TPA: serine/threonine-protein kinase [Polyangiales bacterium]|nr:serine/threonine-protein kinase [Polyangiales bacterium]